MVIPRIPRTEEEAKIGGGLVVLSQKDAVALVKDELYPLWQSERDRLELLDQWLRGEHDMFKLPHDATEDAKRLIELARTPLLGLSVTTIAQAMAVDSYRSPSGKDTARAWRRWRANRLDSGQIALYKAALGYGSAYVVGLPGVDRDGEPLASLRGVSPKRMIAVYADPVWDEWPVYALEVQTSGKSSRMLTLYEDDVLHRIGWANDELEYIDWQPHNAGVCPVVRYAQVDLDGRHDGEVRPFTNVAARVEKTIYDRLLIQHNNSWRVITAAGMKKPEGSEADARKAKLQLRQDSILIAEDPDTKFSSLPETQLNGIIEATKQDIETLSAVTQTPTHNLTGQMINLSAEALAAARAPLTQKVAERQRTFGDAHEQALRLAAHIDGDAEGATDYEARITWQDMEIRSLSQAADALGKIAQMLGVPVEGLWGKIPNVTKSDTDEWKRMRDEGDPLERMSSMLQDRADADA